MSTYTPDPADNWTVTRWMDKQGRIWRRETGGRWVAFDAGRIRIVGVPPKDELADVIAAVGALVPIDVDRIAPVLAELGRLRALAAAGRLLPADAEPLPFEYLDDVVEIQLRAHSYPYGNGHLGAGVQVTLDDGRGIIRAVRLPAGPARDLALAILAGVGPWLPAPTTEETP